MNSEILNNTKIVLIGEGTVGKTSLRRSFIGESFRANYIETMGSDFSFKNLTLDGVQLGIAVWDLAGQEKFFKVHPLFYKGSYGCIVIFSIVDYNSFQKVPDWIERFLSYTDRDNLPIMIIGNKIDLADSNPGSYVSEKDQDELINQLKQKYDEHDISSIRTSALTGENVEHAFHDFGRSIINWITQYKETKVTPTIPTDIEMNIPGSYAFVMNQLIGPMLIGSSPMIDLVEKEASYVANSGIKLIASLDFNDIASSGSIISTFPWSNPLGILHYIAFVIENEQARGNRELFIVGVNVNRELEDVVQGIRGVLNGFLHNAMNEFIRLLVEKDVDLVTKKIDYDDLMSFIVDTEDLLESLREKVNESVLRWYNIPK